MASRKILTAVNEVLNAENAVQLSRAQQDLANIVEEPEEEIEQTPADRIAQMLSGFGDSERAEVKLYRVTGPNKYSWCDDYAAPDFENGGLSMIRRVWGPGEYQIRLYATRPGEKLFAVRAKENIVLEASKDVSAPLVSQTSELSQVLQTIAQGQQQMLTALTEKPAAPDPMAQMMNMMSMMKLMREAMGIDGKQEKSSLSDIVSAIRELREVSEEINPKPAIDSDNPLSMLPQVLELVKAGMGQQAPQMLPQQQPVSIPQMTTAPIQQPQTAESEEAMKFAAIAELKTKLKPLIESAKNNEPIEKSAEFVYDELPDEGVEILFSDEWFDILSLVESDVKPYKEWFTKVRDAVLPMFDDAPEVDPPAPL